MGDKDPSPFGYTFSTGFLDGEPGPYDPSQSLLTDLESQSIADFFSNTDPFHLSDHHAFAPVADTKDGVEDFANWANFVTPATVHGVSTTIPDQSHLHNTLFNDNAYTQPPLPVDHLGNTHDDLQAASTLFQNSQSSYTDNTPLSYHALPTSTQAPVSNEAPAVDAHGKPLIPTQHGLLAEQLAALLPNHAEEGTLDAQFAAHWAGRTALDNQRNRIDHRPSLKRSYTFGTDDSFNNAAGYSSPNNPESMAPLQRLVRDMYGPKPVGPNGERVSLIGHVSPPKPNDGSEDDQSEDITSDEDDDEKPAKKRRKSKLGKGSAQKAARNGKNRKPSAAEENGKKKRQTAAQKLQRENLTEEQKRSNHILSEQKRRNLIKRGFDELHDLVPEIRNGGLSKSSVLTEAANFLEKLIEENKNFRQLTGG